LAPDVSWFAGDEFRSCIQGSIPVLDSFFTVSAQLIDSISKLGHFGLRRIGVYMKKSRLALALLAPLSFAAAVPCVFADQFRLPEEIGRIEAPRDMHLLQVEPTILDEDYYTRGGAERHQFIGNTLPAGAQIPDSDYPVPAVGPHGAVTGMKSAPQAVPSAAAPAVINGSGSMSSRSAGSSASSTTSSTSSNSSTSTSP
jgi:hypothetical protein